MDERVAGIESDFAKLGIDMSPLEVPNGKDEEELKDIVRILLQAIPDECDLTLDITHGFRSSPFVFSVAAQYLSFLRPSVTIEGLYYGMLGKAEPNSAPRTPLVDMSIFLELMDWATRCASFATPICRRSWRTWSSGRPGALTMQTGS